MLVGPVGLTDCLLSHRKRTMFQNIVNATEPMAEEKDAINFISNNPTRKEIVMYVTSTGFYRPVCLEKDVSPVAGCHLLPPYLPCIPHLQGHDDDRL